MSTAEFHKPQPDPRSPDQDGGDSRKTDALGNPVDVYQMVPVGGIRTFNVRISGPVQIEVFSSLGAKVSIDGSSPSKALTISSIAPLDRVFTIHGISEGRTTIFALDNSRTILDRMLVSVKKERSLTYNLHRLGDSRRDAPRTMAELRSLMVTVEKVYLLQANVRLKRIKENEMLRIKENLGDPIDVSQPLIPQFPTARANFRVVLAKRLAELNFQTENLNLVSSWSLTGAEGSLGGFTPDLGTTCVCEGKVDPIAEATTYIHEMGHALGLTHGGHDASDLMNNVGIDSFRMIQPDIDVINPSGTSPLPQS